MKLTLDYSQRLNLHALIGAQRVSVDELRLFWRLQDMIELTAQEKLAINYRTVPANGTTQVLWDMGKGLPPQDYDFAPDEFQRISKLVREWQPGYLTGADRNWLEPLIAQLENAQAKESPLLNGPASSVGLQHGLGNPTSRSGR